MNDVVADTPTDSDGDPLVCLPGQIFGGYEIVRFMTNGGTCQIFEAKHAIMHRRVVIKVQKAHLRANTKRAHRIATEAMALAHIDHPNVVKVYHCDVDSRVGIYIVQEFLEGRDLRETLTALNKTGRRLALKVAAAITLEVADALAAFHAVSILHRDIKPENVFIVSKKTADSSVKLLDLGIAKMPDGVAKTTDKNVAPGTVPYMAAEQLAEGTASPQSDIFSLALVFDEMLSGQHAFAPANLDPGNREIVARTRILHGMYKTLEERGLDAPPALVAFLRRCLAVNPAERPATMEAFAGELRAMIRAVTAESGPNDAVTALPQQPAAPEPLPITGKHTERMRERPKSDASRALPPFACELSAPLSCASLILTEAPGAWRFMRIPLPIERNPTLVFRGILQLGQNSDIAIPGLPPMSIHEDFEGELRLSGGHVKRPAGALRPYELFRSGEYTFQFVPPTPDGLGIPPDYGAITTESSSLLDVPSLVVRGGHKSVLGRKFPLRALRVRVGGRVDVEVPLFRAQVPIAATLSWEPHVGAFRVRVEQKTLRVQIRGAREDEGLLGPLGMIEVDGWQLVLIPPDPRRRA